MAKITAILLIGTLSMFYAEVLSGASHLWFLDPWGLIITMPLYLFHTILLLNLAIKTKRTSLKQLYYWGIFFGLYESWITKVLWAGYIETGKTMFGKFLGIAWAEFLTLVLFWHPIMSFIIPILTYEVLSRNYLPNHKKYLTKNRRKTLIIMLILMIGASFQSTNSKNNLAIAMWSMIGSIAIIIILDILTRNKSIESIKLGRKGFTITIIYLATLYTATFFLMLPERIPTDPIAWISIISWYIITAILLKRSKPIEGEEIQVNLEAYSKKDFIKYMAILLILTLIMCLIPSLSHITTIALLLSIIAIAPIIFIKTLIR